MHPDLRDARHCIHSAHIVLQAERSLHARGWKGHRLQYALRAYCRALDYLWDVQERLGYNGEKFYSKGAGAWIRLGATVD